MKWAEDWFRNILAGHFVNLEEALIKRLDEIEQNLAERIDAIEIAAADCSLESERTPAEPETLGAPARLRWTERKLMRVLRNTDVEQMKKRYAPLYKEGKDAKKD